MYLVQRQRRVKRSWDVFAVMAEAAEEKFKRTGTGMATDEAKHALAQWLRDNTDRGGLVPLPCASRCANSLGTKTGSHSIR